MGLTEYINRTFTAHNKFEPLNSLDGKSTFIKNNIIDISGSDLKGSTFQIFDVVDNFLENDFIEDFIEHPHLIKNHTPNAGKKKKKKKNNVYYVEEQNMNIVSASDDNYAIVNILLDNLCKIWHYFNKGSDMGVDGYTKYVFVPPHNNYNGYRYFHNKRPVKLPTLANNYVNAVTRHGLLDFAKLFFNLIDEFLEDNFIYSTYTPWNPSGAMTWSAHTYTPQSKKKTLKWIGIPTTNRY